MCVSNLAIINISYLLCLTNFHIIVLETFIVNLSRDNLENGLWSMLSEWWKWNFNSLKINYNHSLDKFCASKNRWEIKIIILAWLKYVVLCHPTIKNKNKR